MLRRLPRPAALLALIAAVLLGGGCSANAEQARQAAAAPGNAVPVDSAPSVVAAPAPVVPVAAAAPVDSAPVDSAPADSGASAATPAPVVAAAPVADTAKPAVAGNDGATTRATTRTVDDRWPVKGPAPLPGAILPAKRIVAFYGNPLSRRMGILGELPPDQMLARLDREVARWEKADPDTPVQPALHLIVVVAQGSAGRDGKWRARMADTLIQRVAGWAERRNALLFLDIQVGLSTLREELPRLEPWLVRPNVHLGIDPEFSMKGGHPPGTRVGTFDAADVNYATQYLAELVAKHGLPPKVFVVHRYTQSMLTNTAKIRLDPRVQIVIHMDGWGPPKLKRDSYRAYVQAEPVQYPGVKLFYRNDTKKGHPLMTPEELLGLHPRPLYVQYQ